MRLMCRDIRTDVHRAEFVELKPAPHMSYALLPEKNRPRRRDCGQNGREQRANDEKR